MPLQNPPIPKVSEKHLSKGNLYDGVGWIDEIDAIPSDVIN